MRTTLPFIAVIAGYLALLPGQALAYIGPGLGLGAIGAVLGVVGGLFLALFAVLYYPFKRMISNRKNKPTDKINPGAPSE